LNDDEKKLRFLNSLLETRYCHEQTHLREESYIIISVPKENI